MQVILFIGHHKVGSTSLQQFLSENHRNLLQAGILYPSVEAQGFAHNIANALNPDIPTHSLPINVREAHNALAFKMMAENSKRKVPPYHKNLPNSRQMLVAIQEQIKVLKPHTVILCAEVFANFAAVDRLLIRQLYNAFKMHDITLTCTLRRPDEYVTSWQGQRLKFGQQLEPLDGAGLESYFPTIHFDYQKMLKAWIDIFKGARLVLRDYRDVLKSGGSVEDFIIHSGADFPKNLPQSANSNPSIARPLMEIARRANHVLSGSQSHELRQYLLNCPERIALPPNRDVEMFGTKNRALLIKQFAPIHDWLGHITDKAQFFPDIDAAAKLRPLPVAKASKTALKALQKDADQYLGDPAALEFIQQLNLESFDFP